MAGRANFHLHLGHSGAGGNDVAASADYFGFLVIFRVDVLFHFFTNYESYTNIRITNPFKFGLSYSNSLSYKGKIDKRRANWYID